MTPGSWTREQAAKKPPRPTTEAELDAYHAELRVSAEKACGADAEAALRLLRLLRNGVMTESELPK